MTVLSSYIVKTKHNDSLINLRRWLIQLWTKCQEFRRPTLFYFIGENSLALDFLGAILTLSQGW